MSHSRIFELSREPFKEISFTPDDIPKWFFYSISDGAEEQTPDERKESIKWLFEYAGTLFDTDGDSFIFKKNGNVEYFKPLYSSFKKVFEEMKLPSLEEFSRMEKDFFDFDLNFFKLSEALHHKYEFYFYVDDWLMPMPEFVRNFFKEGDRYYIGGVVDYHC